MFLLRLTLNRAAVLKRTFWMIMAAMEAEGLGWPEAIHCGLGAGVGMGRYMTYKERAACCGWLL